MPNGDDEEQHFNITSKGQEGTKMKTFTVQIADKTGHTVAQMTQEEVVERLADATNTWVYVNDTSVSIDDFASMDLEDDSLIRLMPPIVGGSDNTTALKVKIPSSAGHTTVLMSKQELVDKATSEQNNSWPFVNGEMLNLQQLVEHDLTEDDDIILMPQIVGGQSNC